MQYQNFFVRTTLPIFVLLTLLSPAAMARSTEVFLDTYSLSFSEIAPIKQLVDGMEGPMVDRGSVAFSSNRISWGQTMSLEGMDADIGLALFSRIDYALRFTPDTAYMVYASENDIPIDPSTSKDVYLRANHIKANGLSLIYRGRQFAGLEYQVALSYLAASEMIYGGLTGDLTSLDADAQGNLDLDYSYTEDVFFERGRSDLKAQGYTADLTLRWQPAQRYKVEIFARDLYSRVTWNDQFQTQATATTNRTRNDVEGNVSVRATLSWRETESVVEQKLPRQLSIKGAYQLTGQGDLIGEVFDYDGFTFYRMGYQHKINGEHVLRTWADLTARALSVEWHHRYVSFGLISDSIDIEQAKVFGLQLTLSKDLTF